MGGRACVLVLVSACSYSPGAGTAPADSAEPDDTAPDMQVNANCFGQFGTVCLAGLPTQELAIGNTESTIVTDVLANCEAITNDSNVNGCVVSGTSVTIDGTLIGTGGKPLILIATDGPLIVQRLLDVSSHGEVRGAGANPTGACTGATIAEGAAGGAGGSLGGTGGGGGAGVGGAATTAAPGGVPASLRGGCPGRLGGTPMSSTAGGSGGGAIWLISNERIVINGVVNASGAGGQGGPGDPLANHGGAGGGSGGMIVLDAPIVEISATGVVMATGGGGGGGNASAFSGLDGDDPDPMNPDDPADGGTGVGGDSGGDGGTTGNGGNGDSEAGSTGCGGGGGTGYIRGFGTLMIEGAAFPVISTN